MWMRMDVQLRLAHYRSTCVHGRCHTRRCLQRTCVSLWCSENDHIGPRNKLQQPVDAFHVESVGLEPPHSVQPITHSRIDRPNASIVRSSSSSQNWRTVDRTTGINTCIESCPHERLIDANHTNLPIRICHWLKIWVRLTSRKIMRQDQPGKKNYCESIRFYWDVALYHGRRVLARDLFSAVYLSHRS